MTLIHTVKFKNLVIHIRPYFWHRSNGRIEASLDIVAAGKSLELRVSVDRLYEWTRWDTALTDAAKNKIDNFLKSEEGKKFLDLESEVWKEPWQLFLKATLNEADAYSSLANERYEYVKLHPTVDKERISR